MGIQPRHGLLDHQLERKVPFRILNNKGFVPEDESK
jgi:hypothetical protein